MPAEPQHISASPSSDQLEAGHAPAGARGAAPHTFCPWRQVTRIVIRRPERKRPSGPSQRDARENSVTSRTFRAKAAARGPTPDRPGGGARTPSCARRSPAVLTTTASTSAASNAAIVARARARAVSGSPAWAWSAPQRVWARGTTPRPLARRGTGSWPRCAGGTPRPARSRGASRRSRAVPRGGGSPRAGAPRPARRRERRQRAPPRPPASPASRRRTPLARTRRWSPLFW